MLADTDNPDTTLAFREVSVEIGSPGATAYYLDLN